MPLAEIVVHVDDQPSCASRVAAAQELASAHRAHLVGVGISYPIIAGVGMEGMPTAIYGELEARRDQELAAAGAVFQEAMRRSGAEARSEWRVADGLPVEVLSQQARYADLTVVSQGDAERGRAGDVDLPGDLAIASGRPVLVIPVAGAGTAIGRRCLVAWSGTREAARAVADALVLLEAAEEVTILTVSESGIRETAGIDLARHLGRHGMRAEVRTEGGGGIETGEVIAAVARERGSDLLVMGAYGHSRWREAILGGTTRTLLREMAIPILMSH